MVRVNFKAYNKYVTDSIYQWDINRKLKVSGLNIAVAPEVHFSNCNIDRAIVRQATLSNGIITVSIPNSLLQDPFTINAHIGIYDGGEFKTVENVEIPVIPRERPADYQIEDTNEEIYSFKALENALNNKASNARVDNIIAHNNNTEGNAELIDIRTDVDGNVHESAGAAIRSHINSLTDSVRRIVDPIVSNGTQFPLLLSWEFGGIHSSTGENVKSYIYLRTPSVITFDKDVYLTINVKSGYAFVYEFDDNNELKRYKSYSSDVTRLLTAGTKYRFVLAPETEKVTLDSVLNYGVFSVKSTVSRSVLTGKVINLIGDSITSVDYTRPTWWELISEKFGVMFNNYGQSGTTLAHTDDRHLWDYSFEKESAASLGYDRNDPTTWNTGNCFVERVDETDITADGVVVMGGTNDSTVPRGEWNSVDTSTFYGALNVLVKNLLTTFAGKPILICTMIQTKGSYVDNVADPLSALMSKQDTDTLSLQLRAEAIKIKCRQYGIPCLDLFNSSGINGADANGIYYRDDLHPSAIGQERLSAIIRTELEKLFNS